MFCHPRGYYIPPFTRREAWEGWSTPFAMPSLPTHRFHISLSHDRGSTAVRILLRCASFRKNVFVLARKPYNVDTTTTSTNLARQVWGLAEAIEGQTTGSGEWTLVALTDAAPTATLSGLREVSICPHRLGEWTEWEWRREAAQLNLVS